MRRSPTGHADVSSVHLKPLLEPAFQSCVADGKFETPLEVVPK